MIQPGHNMWYATVETDMGDHLRVMRFDGRTGGKATLSMILGIYQHCSAPADESSEMQKWFLQLETQSGLSICELAKILMNSFYSGEREFEEDEFAVYQKRSQDKHLTEEKFVASVRAVKQRWGDAKILAANVNKLINLLLEFSPESTWWYESPHSVPDLIALSQTLAIAIARGADSIVVF
jgi:hypothetical protein